MAAQASPAQTLQASAGTLTAAHPNAQAGPERAEQDARWAPVLGLPCELLVDLAVPGFKIADLLQLHAGSLVNAHWRVGHDIPLRLNGTLIGWSDLEVMGNRLAVRLTELA